MSRFVTCVYTTPGTERQPPNKVLSIFVVSTSFTSEHLESAVGPIARLEGPFDIIQFVGYPKTYPTLKALHTRSAYFSRIAARIKRGVTVVQWITFNPANGQYECIDMHTDNPVIGGDALIAVERRRSLTAAFKAGGGLVPAPEGFHFAKPSGKHAAKFLRVANVLEQSADATQLGFWLLGFVARGGAIERIIIDTSGIAAVALAVAYEAKALGLLPSLPVIESHNSYGGLGALDIESPRQTLLLISASTSGGLRAELERRRGLPQNIVTLFYLGNEAAEAGPVVCDLTQHRQANPDGLQPIVSFEEANCTLCKGRSVPVPLEGDQFRLEPPAVQTVDILFNDLPDQQRATLAKLSGLRLFAANATSGPSTWEIFFDVASLFREPESAGIYSADTVKVFQERWARLVKRGIPIHLERVIYSSYPGSESLANDAHALATSSGFSVDRPTMGPKVKDINKIPRSASLVISACVEDSYELMTINRDLRVVQPEGNTTYITPILRYSTQAERRRIESNLQFGEVGAQTFNLYHVEALELPDCAVDHSWSTELDVLKGLRDWCEQEEAVPTEIDQRICILEQSHEKGLIDGIFWPSHTGDPLRLRGDFTFVATYGGQKVLSQADVFVIASAILHRYRGSHPTKRLAYTSYERNVIDPSVFDRFNDGIIQAAILRASRGRELCYRFATRALSREMLGFLLAELRGTTVGQGEALMEFLIALLTGRLQLLPEHEREFFSHVAGAEHLPNWLRLTAQYACTGGANEAGEALC